MTDILRQILQMSLYGSIAIICVMAFRALCRKLPKRITCLFWIIVAVRLLCPINIGSQFSVANLLSGMSDVSDRIVFDNENDPETSYGTTRAVTVPQTDLTINASVYTPVTFGEAGSAASETSQTTAGSRIPVVTIIWVTGTAALLSFISVKAISMKIRLKGSRRDDDGTFTAGNVASPFVTGLIRPKVFMPDVLSEKERSYLLLHEQTHIKYFDHVTKVIGVIAVCIHWFNPLVWLAFILFCRDLEMRVDETVIETMGEQIKKEYCLSLVSFAKTPAIYRVLGTAFSVRSFRGSEVKMRINNLINYKKISRKLGIIIIAGALGASAILSSCAKSTVNKASSAGTTEVTEDAVQAGGTAGENNSEKDKKIMMALSFLDEIAYDVDSVYVDDYGPETEILWNDSIASAAVADPYDYSNEDIRTIVSMYADQCCEIYDLNKICEGHGGLGYHEGFLVCSQSGDGYEVALICRTSDRTIELRNDEDTTATVSIEDSTQRLLLPMNSGNCMVTNDNSDLTMTVLVGRTNTELLRMDFSFE